MCSGEFSRRIKHPRKPFPNLVIKDFQSTSYHLPGFQWSRESTLTPSLFDFFYKYFTICSSPLCVPSSLQFTNERTLTIDSKLLTVRYKGPYPLPRERDFPTTLGPM